jgi:hypothetical protein
MRYLPLLAVAMTRQSKARALGSSTWTVHLDISEGAAIRDDVLQYLDVGIVVRGIVNVAEHTVRNCEPHFGRGVFGGAHAILARVVEVGDGSGTVKGGGGM